MKSIVFLADGMADEPLPELNGKTPLEYANTPNMDFIARNGANGLFVSLPEGFPTSSDVANMSVLGYDLAQYYPGRGPIEAVSQGIELKPDDIAFRCNLITIKDDILTDYSAGHIDNSDSTELINFIQQKLGNEKVTFYPGVSYRNILVLSGNEFCPNVECAKPDSCQGMKLFELPYKPLANSKEAANTASILTELVSESRRLFAENELIKKKNLAVSAIWPHSPGRKPAFPKFSNLYSGKKGAIISAVDVIFGIGICAGMDIIKVPGATGFIDTNYEGKADAAVKALEDHDFVYLHVEAIDECSHMGRLDLKLKAIEEFDSRIVGPVLNKLQNVKDISYALLPDHPVPVKLRKHTRTPVPAAVMGPHIKPDSITFYSENEASRGALGFIKDEELMKILMNLIKKPI
ncbi:MAG TPA: cofactor-independent phosphoglycerate mutase [Lentisphaeria bacterium]|nr:MAG: cofactor-independent phosphoglycerate mutase [Lentisphaerae bacterium GWF2_38_69]HBM15380.1 cofactor-independent phosphoglycerate mutase [Lentisphaeria bacterium]